MSALDTPGEIVKWYTRARRFPQLIGKTPDGVPLWGGPYTYTQVIGAAALLYLGINTIHVWGRFGFIGNLCVLAGLTYGFVLLLGRLPVGSRNPLSVAAGALKAVNSPTTGRHGGVPLRIRRPHRVHGVLVVTHHTSAAAAAPLQPAPGTSHATSAPPPPTAPAPATPSTVPTRPAAPPLTGVQRLLASPGPTSRHS